VIWAAAASTSEADVERVLATLLEQGTPFDYAAVKALAHPVEVIGCQRHEGRGGSPLPSPSRGRRP
jgi:hypothetical protein